MLEKQARYASSVDRKRSRLSWPEKTRSERARSPSKSRIASSVDRHPMTRLVWGQMRLPVPWMRIVILVARISPTPTKRSTDRRSEATRGAHARAHRKKRRTHTLGKKEKSHETTAQKRFSTRCTEKNSISRVSLWHNASVKLSLKVCF